MANGTYTLGESPAEVIIRACAGKRYDFSLVGGAREVVTNAVNQGIDSHLEAITGSEFVDTGARLEGHVAPHALPVLLRRLFEDGSDEAWSLRADILGTLGIEEV